MTSGKAVERTVDGSGDLLSPSPERLVVYASRPPGMPHGPRRSGEGVLTFEVRHRGAS